MLYRPLLKFKNSSNLKYKIFNNKNLIKNTISIELINEPIIKSLNLELLNSKRRCFPNDCPCSKVINNLSVNDFESKNSKYYYWLPILKSKYDTWCPLDPDPIAIRLNDDLKKNKKDSNDYNIPKFTSELEKMVS
jgi:hypothetical protein